MKGHTKMDDFDRYSEEYWDAIRDELQADSEDRDRAYIDDQTDAILENYWRQ